MRDGQASIHRSLQGAEDLVPRGGPGQTRIQVTGEGPRLPIDALHVELLSRHLHLALVHLVHPEFVQQLRRRQTANVTTVTHGTKYRKRTSRVAQRDRNFFFWCGYSYPTCQQQPGAVRRGVVGEADSDPVFGQLVGVGRTHDLVPFDFGVGNLETRTKSGVRTTSLAGEPSLGSCRTLTWQQMSLLESRTIIRYLGVLYLFLSCTTSRFRAK